MFDPKFDISVISQFIPEQSDPASDVYSFTYNSGTQIASPVGSMHGTYLCVAEDTTVFEAQIPVFSLRADSPEVAAASALH